MNKKILTTLLLSLCLTGCYKSEAVVQNKNETPQRKYVTIGDIVNRDKITDKNKLKLISDINPDEQYAIGIITTETPMSGREALSKETVGQVVQRYEDESGESVENGPMEYANDLRFKELQITSALILYTQTISKEDQALVKNYIAKRLFKPKEMAIADDTRIRDLVKLARQEAGSNESTSSSSTK